MLEIDQLPVTYDTFSQVRTRHLYLTRVVISVTIEAMKIAILTMFLLISCSHSQRGRSLSSSKSVLYIGDSQSEGFLGGMVYKHLDEVSKVEDIRVYGVSSSSPRHWGDKRSSKHAKWLCARKGRKNLSSRVSMKKEVCKGVNGESAFSYLNSKKPDLVIFQFLGNSMGFNESFIGKKVKQLLTELSQDQQCLFITSPPYYKDLVERNKLRLKTQSYFIKGIGSRCKIVQGFTEESFQTYAHARDNYLGDGAHLSRKGASEFMKIIIPELP